MRAESEILAEVETLKAKFSDTRALYREVCVLLFFRYGITPTANKLYQYVRRGSMNVPTEEVASFWDDLRHKARVDIEHPDMPVEVKAIAAEAIAALWRQATDAARGELAAARLELQAEAETARAAQAQAELLTQKLQESAAQLQAELAQRDDALRALQAELEAERRSHVGAQARGLELQTQLEQARVVQQRQQEAFSADLAKAREAVDAAQERAAAAERRALLEIDGERQARARSDKTAESLRDRLAEAEGRERQQALEHAEVSTRLQMELTAAKTALQQAQHGAADHQRDIASLRQQLAEVQQAAARHHAEAQTLQALVARLAPAPPSPEAMPPTRASRRKAATNSP